MYTIGTISLQKLRNLMKKDNIDKLYTLNLLAKT